MGVNALAVWVNEFNRGELILTGGATHGSGSGGPSRAEVDFQVIFAAAQGIVANVVINHQQPSLGGHVILTEPIEVECFAAGYQFVVAAQVA